MKLLRILLLAACVLPCLQAATAKPDVMRDFIGRILPADAARVECVVQPDSLPESFTYSCDGSVIRLHANTPVAAAVGLNNFLRDELGITLGWGNMSATLPAELPRVAPLSRKAAVPVRYYLNFCTHSYSMAFWDTARWLREIDWMALHGINAPLITEGFECVWADMLARGFGYTDRRGIESFLPGPAYFAWFYMNNLTGWGGPLPESWFENRLTLARDIFSRMSELGMQAVVPGYSGMIPEDFLSYAHPDSVAGWQASDIAPTGKWCGFTRPAIVADTTRLQQVAERYYASVDRLFGDVLTTPYYAIDPFHEGGRIPEGFDCRAAVGSLWKSLLEHEPDAVWVAQHWQENPRTFVTEVIPGGRLLILDLHSESLGTSACGGNSTDASGRPHRWVYGMLNNYGGNTGLFGRAPLMAASLAKALEQAEATNLAGVGTIPEGIENNPMLFDLLYDYVWQSPVPDLDTWLSRYAAARYGAEPGSAEHEKLAGVWNTLAHGILNCPTPRQQGVTESVMLQRPASAPAAVSAWANSSWYWNSDSLRRAVCEFASLAPKLGHNPNYRMDLVDFVRQCVADSAHTLLAEYSSTPVAGRKELGRKFRVLMLMQDELTARVPQLDFAHWVGSARALGTTEDEKDLYEKNARMLVTTWGDRPQANGGNLRDYGNREWSGLLQYYYLPRWKKWFEQEADYDWFGLVEWPFVQGESVPYGSISPAETPGDAVAKAFSILSALCTDTIF